MKQLYFLCLLIGILCSFSIIDANEDESWKNLVAKRGQDKALTAMQTLTTLNELSEVYSSKDDPDSLCLKNVT